MAETTVVNTNESTGFIISQGDGKGIAIPDGFRMVKVAEVLKGKRGKGKTIAYVNIPLVKNPVSSEDCSILMPMILETVSELQKDIVVRMTREGLKAVTNNDLSIGQCFLEWTNKSFNAETVGNWFDAEVSALLAFQICTAKGFDPELISNELESNTDATKLSENAKFVQTRVNSYRASYVETASKFPSLNPNQCTELLRVLDLLELSGAVVSRIRDKITPKPVSATLGFV